MCSTKASFSVSSCGYELGCGQYFIYGRADRMAKDDITIEQSHYSKIHESQSLYRADSGSATFG